MRSARSQIIARLGLLTALTLVIQIMGLPQPITGPLINGILLLTVLWIGPGPAIVLGLMTPLAALIRGHLPPVLFPMLPVIMLGNVIFVSLFFLITIKLFKTEAHLLKSLPGLTAASAVKTILLFTGANCLIPVIFNKAIPKAAVAMMSFPQFITAMAGGIGALILYRYLFLSKGRI